MDSLDHLYQPRLRYNEGFTNTALRYSGLVNSKLNRRNTIRAGVILSRHGFNLSARGINQENNQIETYLDQSGNTVQLQYFAQWMNRITEDLTLNAGLHSNHLWLNQNLSVEPRLGLKWTFRPAQNLSFGFGKHTRMEPMSVYSVQQQLDDNTIIYPNKHLKF